MVRPPIRLMLAAFGDDRYHDHHAACALLRELFVCRGFDVLCAEDASSLVPETLRRCDVVVLYAVNATAPAQNVDFLCAAIRGGLPNDRGRPVGFCGVHGATTSFQESEEFKQMLGASFVSHPDMGPLYEFNVHESDHPVTAGVKDFRLKDELYFFNIHTPLTVLVSCRHENVARPVVWIKNYGAGKVFSISLGHGREQMSDPNFQTLLFNGAHWAAAS